MELYITCSQQYRQKSVLILLFTMVTPTYVCTGNCGLVQICSGLNWLGFILIKPKNVCIFNHHQVNPSVPLSKKVMYDLFKQIPSHYPMRDGWRCVTMGGGVQSVLTPSPPPGVRRMLRWCVGSWDSVEPSTPYCKIRESTNLSNIVSRLYT